MARFPDPDGRNALAADCQQCPELVEGRTCISWGVGARDATLVVVGEAPGAGTPEADRWQGGNHTGMAYTSRHSGRRVRGLFETLGYGPDDLYQDVWVRRLGYDLDSYRQAIGDALADLGAAPD